MRRFKVSIVDLGEEGPDGFPPHEVVAQSDFLEEAIARCVGSLDFPREETILAKAIESRCDRWVRCGGMDEVNAACDKMCEGACELVAAWEQFDNKLDDRVSAQGKYR